MIKIIERIEKLREKSKYIKLYSDVDRIILLKNINKIPGSLDKEYFDFLSLTNGASILDYCFLGIKNNAFGENLSELITDLWQENTLLTLKFWGIVATSTNEYFGYLDKKNSAGTHYIGYYSGNNPDEVYFVASSFSIFLSKFLDQIELVLNYEKEVYGLQNNDWFSDIQLLTENDDELQKHFDSTSGKTNYFSEIYNY